MASGGGYGDASQEYDYLLRVVLIGDSKVGKSQILARFAGNEFRSDSRPTIGVEFQSRTLVIQHKSVKAQIWDTAGQERFRHITSAYYRGAVGVVVVYDITNRPTFDHIPQWLKEIRDYTEENTVFILIGNKSDLEDQRSVPTEEAKEFAKKEGLLFLETSAYKSTNVEDAFVTVFTKIIRIMNKESLVESDEENANTEKIIVPTQGTTNKKEMEDEEQGGVDGINCRSRKETRPFRSGRKYGLF